MSNLTRDQLRALAATATERLEAELELHGVHPAAIRINGGMVRAVVEALESAGYLLTRLDAIGPALVPKGRPIVASPRNGAYRDYSDNEKGLFPHYTPEEVAQMGDPAPFPAPEPPAAKVADDDDDESPFADFAPDEIEDGGEDVETTPLREPYQVPTPVDARDDDPDHELHPTWTPKQHALYLRLAPLLQRLARDGYMPTRTAYEANHGDLPAYNYLLQVLDCKWSDLALWLGLKVQSRHYGPGKGKKKEHEAAPSGFPTKLEEPHPEGSRPAVPRLRGTALLDANGLVESVSQATVPSAPTPILHRAPDGGVTRILPRPDNSQAHSLPSAFAERNSDGRQVRPAYRRRIERWQP